MLSRYRLDLLVVWLLCGQAFCLYVDSSSLPKSIKAAELEKGTRIIGQLGLPLGELASVKARVVESKAKGTDRYIEVIEVDGRVLVAPSR